MTTEGHVHGFLENHRIAVVGVSREEHSFSRQMFRELLDQGYDAVPVHPEADRVDGEPAFRHVSDIQPPPQAVLFLTPGPVTERLLEDCADAGVKWVWLHRGQGPGAVTHEALRFCESHGINVVPGACLFMFLPRKHLVHRVHRFWKQLTGTLPS